MLRTVVVLALIAGIGFAGYKWAVSGPGEGDDNIYSASKRQSSQTPEGDRSNQQSKSANPGIPGDGSARTVMVDSSPGLTEPLVIPEARVTIIESQTVSSQRSGELLFLGKEVSPERVLQLQQDNTKANQKDSRFITERVPFLAVLTSEEERVRLKVPGYRIAGDNRLWRRWTAEDRPQPSKLEVLSEEKTFERLKEGDQVKPGELIGLVNPALAEAELRIKIAELDAAQASFRASEKTRDEAEKRWRTQVESNNRVPGSVSPEEMRGAELTFQRYVHEAEEKGKKIDVARSQVLQNQTLLSLHEIRAKYAGDVRKIYRRAGEALKEQEQVLQIQNPSVLQAEALVELQYARKLEKNMPVVVEPTPPEAPSLYLRGHREAVNSIAVSKGTEPYIVSGGEDRNAFVWLIKQEVNRETGKKVWSANHVFTFEHPSPVRAVACTGPGAKRNLCLTGTADGLARLWDLDAPKTPSITFKEIHRGPIHKVAFSPNGKWCATAGEDGDIRIVDCETHQQKYHIKGAHRGAVTSIAFSQNDQLVSSGKDRRLGLWELPEKGDAILTDLLENLGGAVDDLGLFVHTPKRANAKPETVVLFDQGRQLRLLSSGKTTRGVITSTTASANFTTFALFSPDGKLVLTTSSADNRVQLWRNPMFSSRGRAAEMRQLIWTQPTNCAAFAPELPILVTGTKDQQVLVWNLPTDEELNEPQENGILTYVAESVEDTKGQVRIIALVRNRTPGLRAGSTASLVIYPK